MAVFTPVEEAEAEPFIRRFGAGRLGALTPIAEGIQNTNYRVETDRGRFVLTLFEARTEVASLPFSLELTKFLAGCDLPTARPLENDDGRLIDRLNGRPAAVLNWLDGDWKREPSLRNHAAAGEMLARLHLAADGFDAARSNPVGPSARHDLFQACALRATGTDRVLLDRCAPWVEANPAAICPKGRSMPTISPTMSCFRAMRSAGSSTSIMPAPTPWPTTWPSPCRPGASMPRGWPSPRRSKRFKAGMNPCVHSARPNASPWPNSVPSPPRASH